MRSVLTRWVCAVAVAMLFNVGPAHAGVIVSNLSQTMNGHSTIYAAGPPQEYAQEFITGSQSVGLGTVIALVGDATGTFNPSAELVTDNSGQPSSTVVTTFTVPTIPTGTTSSGRDLHAQLERDTQCEYQLLVHPVGQRDGHLRLLQMGVYR